MSKRAIYLVPLSVFLVMAVYFAIGLTKDPKIIPSALIDKLIPEFSLPPIDNGTPQGYGKGFSSADFKAGGISVVNVFASWCLPCRAEHPFITKLSKMNVAKVYGLNFKDTPKTPLSGCRNLATPTTPSAPTPGAASASTGAFTGFRKPSSSTAPARSTSNTSAP